MQVGPAPAVNNARKHAAVGEPELVQRKQTTRKERYADKPVHAIHRALEITRLIKTPHERAPIHLPAAPRAAPAMSHIGRNTPSARTNTRLPMSRRRMGSAFAESPSTSIVTSRSYISAISPINEF